MNKNNILIVNENKYLIYSIKDNKYYDFTETVDYNKILILDNSIELKVITIPVVSQNKIINIIQNSLKRYSAIDTNIDEIDYKILNKNENKYVVLVFINRATLSKGDKNKKIFSLYNVVEKLYKEENVEENAVFLIKYEEVYFSYYFKNGVFLKRSVHFEENIDLLTDAKVYFISLFNEDICRENYITTPKEKIFKILSESNNNIFRLINFKNILTRVILFFLFLSFILTTTQIFFGSLKEKEKILLKELESNQSILKEIAGQKKLSDTHYEEYVKLLSDKSDIYYLFNILYYFGENNIEIDNFTTQGVRFSVSGVCKDYINLERNLRKSAYLKEIRFNITNNKDRNYFRIEGMFNNDRKK